MVVVVVAVAAAPGIIATLLLWFCHVIVQE